MTRPILHRQVSWTFDDETECLEDMGLDSRAIPTGRAADASHSSLLRVSTKSGIAIAAFALLYFGGELLRAVLS